MSKNPQKSILQQLQNTANKSQVSSSSDSDSSDTNSKSQQSSVNDNTDNEENAESMAEEAQLAEMQQEANQQEVNSSSSDGDDSTSAQSDSSSSSLNTQDNNSISEEKANFQPTDDKQGQEKDIDSKIDTNSNPAKPSQSSSEDITNNSDISDLATQPQAQSNLAKNNSEASDDLQDVSSPNFFLLKSQTLHNKFLSLLQKDYYNHSLNKSSEVNAVIALDKFAFNNLYRGVNKIVQYTNRRNNEVENDTNHMKEQASKGAKTIKLWQNEGIFANLSNEMRTLSDVVNDPRFQTFAKKIKGGDLQVPKTLREKGIKAKNDIDKREQQKVKQGGGNSSK